GELAFAAAAIVTMKAREQHQCVDFAHWRCLFVQSLQTLKELYAGMRRCKIATLQRREAPGARAWPVACHGQLVEPSNHREHGLLNRLGIETMFMRARRGLIQLRNQMRRGLRHVGVVGGAETVARLRHEGQPDLCEPSSRRGRRIHHLLTITSKYTFSNV